MMAYPQSSANGYRNPSSHGINNAPFTTNTTTTKHTNGHTMASLHDASQTPLPPSSPVIKSPRPELGRTMSTPRPSPNPQLRRTSSSMSLQSDRRSSSPALFRKSSTSSLRGDIPSTPTRLGTRRSSSQLNPNPPLPPAMEEPPVTENSIAEDWFKQELERHESADAAVNTVVILHEACYGHRFARPKTTKSTLGLIVERPERIEASTMGISAAYVRLGERHNEGQYAPDPRVRPPPHLPFKIRRTARTLPINSPAVTQVHGTKWMEELKVMCNSTAEKLASTGRETERPPDPTQKNKPAFHSGDLYLCQDSLAAFEGALGGVCDGVDAVFTGAASGAGPSQAFVCIRPPGHHCSADFPSGFCWLNNVHVGIQHAVKEHQLTHAAIIDFDLHHGDGSQAITWEHNQKVASMPKNTPALKKTAIGYYSIHDINSYPCENGDPDKILNASICLENAHNQSIWNVHLQPWRTETEFWDLYETKYIAVLEKARVFLRHHTARLRGNPNLPKPRGAIFISAGFDASEHEGAGMQRHSVNVPTEFYARFTRDIVALAQEEGTGVDGRVVSVLEGGYSDKALISGVLSHVSGLCHGQHVAASTAPETSNGLADQMSRLTVGGLSGLSGVPGAGQLAGIDDVALQLRYNSEWWTSEHLDALVEILNPTPAMPALEAVKSGRSNNFASPTQASKMKVIDPAMLHRKSSAQFNRFPGSGAVSRPATPPPPTVHWTVSAQELCKLLIPDRQTKSHTPAELAAPKIKKERASNIGLASVPAAGPAVGGRQLREKRTATVKASPPIPEQSEPKRVVSKAGADRRRTIAANEIAGQGANGAARTVAERPRRRSSIASTVSNLSTAAPPAATAAARPKLATNGSGSGSGVQVKKTRAAPAKPGVPSGAAANGATTSSSSRSTSVDVDSLVAKTQKLKIHMPPNEEYLARQKGRAGSAVPSAAGRPSTGTATAAKKVGAEPRKVGRPPKAVSAAGAAAAKKVPSASAAAKAKSPTNDLTPDIPGTGAFQVLSNNNNNNGAPVSSGAAGGLGAMTGQFQLDLPMTTTTPSMTSATTAASLEMPPVSSPAEGGFPSNVPVTAAPPSQAVPTQQLPQPSEVGYAPHTQPYPPPQMHQPPPAMLWNSTGPLPFAAPPQMQMQPPTQMYAQPQGLFQAANAPAQGGAVSVKQEGGEEGKGSIWDIPDTPAR